MAVKHLNSSHDATEDIVNSDMSAEDIIRALAKHNCVDITPSVDLSSCSEYPCAGGGFCDVYRGKRYDGTRIAIKSLRVYDGPDADKQKRKILKHAAKELYFWSRLQHRNVLPLIGLMLYRGRISMISEWMENGNLMVFLQHRPNADRMCICVDICAGLRYLHDNGMVHGDLKTANVVVSSEGVAMITDFGNAHLKDLTLRFSNTTNATSNSISVRYTAPELLQGDGSGVSKEADVYAYGITALEVLSGQTPYPDLNDFQVIRRVAVGKGGPPRPNIDLIGNDLWDVLASSWTPNPAERPTMGRMGHYLQALHPGCKSHPEQSDLDQSDVSGVKNEAPAQVHTRSISYEEESYSNPPNAFDHHGQVSDPHHANGASSSGGDLEQIAALKQELSQMRERLSRANLDTLNSRSGSNPRQANISRAMSVTHYGLDGVQQRNNVQEETHKDRTEQIRLLSDLDRLDHEIYEGLITSLKIPSTTSTITPTLKEVLFPANLISLISNEMWKCGMIKESERFLANTMQTIQTHVMFFTGEDAIIPGVFWLSNVHEILSFVCRVENDLIQGIGPIGNTPDFDWEAYEHLIQMVKSDLDSLEYNIYHSWMVETKKTLSKMIIPALIETQSLPGFITSEGAGRFFNRLLNQNTTPAFSTDDVLNLLNKVLKSLRCFFMEESVIQQVVTELLKLVGVTSFNDLLMRRNFCSWKRAVQIDNNITQIEEWCKSHEMPEGTLQLEHLMQATKLLQLKKATQADIDIIYDVCWILTPSQIQRMCVNYSVIDYENPIPPEMLKLVAQRVQPNDRTDHLLLTPENEDVAPYELPLPREPSVLEHYIPVYLEVPHIQRLVAIHDKMSERGP